MQKKAQGVSITVVIVAAIALLVLVVLAAIFIGRLGTTRKTIDQCESYGGKCLETCGEPPNEAYNTPTSGYKCLDFKGNVKEDVVCCLRI